MVVNVDVNKEKVCLLFNIFLMVYLISIPLLSSIKNKNILTIVISVILLIGILRRITWIHQFIIGIVSVFSIFVTFSYFGYESNLKFNDFEIIKIFIASIILIINYYFYKTILVEKIL